MKTNPQQAIENYARLFLQIRKEVGFTEKDVNIPKLLSLFMKDMPDSQTVDQLNKIR